MVPHERTSEEGGDPAPIEPPTPQGAGFLRRRWVFFNATVFVAAACIMTVEILSTRLAARYVGSSVYTWTSAIGIVLAGISLGNYVGGRLADRYPPRPTLALAFVASSVACVLVPILNHAVGNWSVLVSLSWPTRIFFHFLIAFLLPATTLGLVGPIVAKMALDLGLATGRTVGTIYAWGSAGSILGTFVAGLWLVPSMGTERVILVVAGLLAGMGLLYGHRRWLAVVWGGAFTASILCAFVPWKGALVAQGFLGLLDPVGSKALFLEDSRYQRVLVEDHGGGERTIQLDALVHGRVDLGDPLRLLYGYEAIYAGVLQRWRPGREPVAAFFVGGGGYVFPRYLELVRPGSAIEVAEIDPVVTRAAFEAFGLPAATSIRTFDLDARNHVADLIRRKQAGEPVPRFDCVFGDAFSDFSIPFHLTTVEFTRLLDELLEDNGLYMLNLIDTLESARLLGAAIRTCRQVFPQVSVFETHAGELRRNTFVLVCSKRPLELDGVVEAIRAEQGYECGRLSDDVVEELLVRTEARILTDDHAPVANLLAPVVMAHSWSGSEERDYSEEILTLFGEGAYERAAERCRELIRKNPEDTHLNAWRAAALARLGRLEEAVQAYRAELRVAPDDVGSRAELARALALTGDIEGALREYRAALEIEPGHVAVRCDLAALLLTQGRADAAESEYREALRRRPGFVRAQLQLGRLLCASERAEAAIAYLERAFELSPELAGVRRDLGRALLETGRAPEAVGHLRAAAALDPDDAELGYLLGLSLAEIGDLRAAAQAFDRAIELAPLEERYRVAQEDARRRLGSVDSR